MTEGWVKIHRRLLDWEWIDDPYMVTFWLRLLLSVNAKDRKGRGSVIKRGQLQTSVHRLSEALGWSHNTIDRILRDLKECGAIDYEKGRGGTLITVLKYSEYQGDRVSPTDTPTDTHADTPADTPADTRGVSPTDNNLRIDKKERKKERKNNISTPLPPQGEGGEKKTKREKPCARSRYDRAFEEVYTQHTGSPFAWSKRENVAINAIVGKIAAMMEQQGNVPTDDGKEYALRWFLTMILERCDEWARSNFSPHVIDNKFNEYYQQIKQNGTQRNKTGNPAGVSADFLAKYAARLDGNL